MALRSLGSVARGGIRAWSSSSPPGIQGALGSAVRSDSDALHGLRNAFFHVDSRNGPVAAAAAAAALSAALAGSRGLHSRAEPASSGALGFAEPEPARSGAPGFTEPEPARSGAPGFVEPARRGAVRFPEPEPGRRGALQFASLINFRELVAEREDEAFATLTAAFFSALFGVLYLMNDEDELGKARKEGTHTNTAYLLSHQLMEEMKREKASYNKTMPDEKSVVQEYMEDDQAMKARFQEWMKEYGKTYKDEVEKARRYKIFKSVARYTDAANTDAAKAGHSVRFGVNEFSDWNAEERARLSGYRTIRDGGYFKMVMSYLALQWIWHQVADNKEF